MHCRWTILAVWGILSVRLCDKVHYNPLIWSEICKKKLVTWKSLFPPQNSEVLQISPCEVRYVNEITQRHSLAAASILSLDRPLRCDSTGRLRWVGLSWIVAVVTLPTQCDHRYNPTRLNCEPISHHSHGSSEHYRLSKLEFSWVGSGGVIKASCLVGTVAQSRLSMCPRNQKSHGNQRCHFCETQHLVHSGWSLKGHVTLKIL